MSEIKRLLELIENIERSDESAFGDIDYSVGDTVQTPYGSGKVVEISGEAHIEKERSLTGHLGKDKRAMDRAKVELDDGTTKWVSLFQLK